MLARRDFLRLTGAATSSLLLEPISSTGHTLRTSGQYFSIHPFIEHNPNAVFIMRTNVDAKTNSEAKKQAGRSFGQNIFTTTDDPNSGIPFSNYFPIKPNLTSWMWDAPQDVDFEKAMGIVSDVDFVEGVIQSMINAGVNPRQISILDANGAENLRIAGYDAIGNRNGVNIQLGINNPRKEWVDVPQGVWFNRIPYLWPINTQNSWLLNIAKFKTHGMGLTLCAKNLQGSIASPYVSHCSAWGTSMGIDPAHIQSNAFDIIEANYHRNRKGGIPRWEVEGSDFTGGLGMETWVTRCLDNQSVLKPGLNVIEAIYGRDGNGFYQGPHNGEAKDFMTNMIIFGKNSLYTDVVGHWLGGHEPGNFGLFHVARERGFIDTFNPHEIPVYEWHDTGDVTLSNLAEFDRTNLLTYYLTRPGEAKWHFCNEWYDYEKVLTSTPSSIRPNSFFLQQNFPNPVNSSTSIEFVLPRAGRIRLEVFNQHGDIVDVIADGHFVEGSHLAVWRNQNLPSGIYFYRLRFNSFEEIKKLIIVR
jgi:uncharacterized protein (DUF362 family)